MENTDIPVEYDTSEAAKLYDSESKFPVDIQDRHPLAEDRPIPHTAKLTAYDFPAALGSFNFGVSKERTAEVLRELATKILAGQILVQRAQVTGEANRSNYTYSALILEFHEKN